MLDDETESTTTVSAEIPERLKRDLDEWDVAVDAVVVDALEAAVRTRRREELVSRADELRRQFAGQLDVNDVVASIQNSRRTQ